jgi:hypothetical protein
MCAVATPDPHWLIRYDPEDGQPYGTTCRCELGADHDAADNPPSVGALRRRIRRVLTRGWHGA